MRAGVGLLVAGVAALPLSPALSQPQQPPEAVLAALTAKSAAIRNYHCRVESANETGRVLYSAETWWAGPQHTRTVFGHGTVAAPSPEICRDGDVLYQVDPSEYQVTKRPATKRGSAWDAYPSELGPWYLTQDDLAAESDVEVGGTETVAGTRCRVIDLGARPRLRLLDGTDFLSRGGDFLMVTPQLQPAAGRRLWVDEETGLIRRWANLRDDKASVQGEIVETQQVNGFEFPLVMTATRYGGPATAQVVEAEVNQGVGKGLAEFHPPPSLLVMDETATVEQTLERLKAAPDDASLHYTLAGHYSQQRKRDLAEQEFRRAAELAPESPGPWLALAKMLQAQSGRGSGYGDEAVLDAYRQALALTDDKGGRIHTALGMALEGAGRLDEAIAEYRQAGQGTLLAEALAKQGDVAGAYRAWAEMPMAPGMMASMLRWEGDRIIEWATTSRNLDDLLAKTEQALAATPESDPLEVFRARVLLAQGRRADAITALKEIPLTPEPGGREVSRELASLCTDLRDHELAERVRRAAIEDAVRSGSSGAIGVFFENGQWREQAITEFLAAAAKALAEAPDRAARGAVLKALGSQGADIYRDQQPERVLPRRDPDAMTPAECAIEGVLAVHFAGRNMGWGAAGVTESWSDRGMVYLKRAVAEWPDDAALWASLGSAYAGLDMQADAAEAYRRAAAADRGDIEYAARAAFALARLEQCKQAIKVAEEAAAPWGDDCAATGFLGVLYMDCGEYQRARDALATAYAAGTASIGCPTLLLGRLLARCHERLGELDEAETVLKEVAGRATAGDRQDCVGDLAAFYGRQGRNDEGYATAKQWYLDGNEWEHSFAAAKARGLFGNDYEALTSAVVADLKAHPNDERTASFASLVYRSGTRLKDALPALRAAAEKAKDPGVWRLVSQLAEFTGDEALAAEALGRARDLEAK
jgi:tetratricopeptide (TPR) repeat protein/outer membrane lipoprotein-sorting protein